MLGLGERSEKHHGHVHVHMLKIMTLLPFQAGERSARLSVCLPSPKHEKDTRH
nr:unnamed protein product [Digitaria exilis]